MAGAWLAGAWLPGAPVDGAWVGGARGITAPRRVGVLDYTRRKSTDPEGAPDGHAPFDGRPGVRGETGLIAVVIWTGVVLGALLALLLLLLGLVLLVPVEVEGAWTEERRGAGLAGPGLRVRFDAGEGTVQLRVLGIRLGPWSTQGTGRRTRSRRRGRRRKGGRKDGRKGPALSPRKLWRQRGRILSAVRAFVRRLRVRRFAASVVIASPDPAWTGWVTGLAYAGRGALPARLRGAVRLRPDFDSEAPRVGAEAAIRLQPLILVVLAVRVWMVVRRARRPRRAGAAGRDERGQPASGAGGRDGAA